MVVSSFRLYDGQCGRLLRVEWGWLPATDPAFQNRRRCDNLKIARVVEHRPKYQGLADEKPWGVGALPFLRAFVIRETGAPSPIVPYPLWPF